MHNLASVSITYASLDKTTQLEIRTGAPDGILIDEYTLPITHGWHNWNTVNIPVETSQERGSLFFVFKSTENQGGYLVNLLEAGFQAKPEGK